MKIKIVSDVHTNFIHGSDHPGEFMEPEIYDQPDVLIIAGDLHEAGSMKEAMAWFADHYEVVIFTPGNHDYYRGNFDDVDADLAQLNEIYPNVYGLQNQSVTIDGVTFHGTTMWFRDHPLNAANSRRMNDFRLIKGFAEKVYDRNTAARKYLESNVRLGDVVVTHHSPCIKSSHPRYANDPLNNFYVCDMTHVMYGNKPAIWAHGHTHDSYDYMIDETRVVCNPFGYFRYQENHGFDPGVMIEV